MKSQGSRHIRFLIKSSVALIATRTCAIASDVLVVVVTWIFAYDSVRQSSAQYGHGIASITKVIVEDGEIIPSEFSRAATHPCEGTFYFM